MQLFKTVHFNLHKTVVVCADWLLCRVTVGGNSFENNAVAPTIPGTTGNTGWPLQSDVLAPPPADPMFVMTISNQAAN